MHQAVDLADHLPLAAAGIGLKVQAGEALFGDGHFGVLQLHGGLQIVLDIVPAAALGRGGRDALEGRRAAFGKLLAGLQKIVAAGGQRGRIGRRLPHAIIAAQQLRVVAAHFGLKITQRHVQRAGLVRGSRAARGAVSGNSAFSNAAVPSVPRTAR